MIFHQREKVEYELWCVEHTLEMGDVVVALGIWIFLILGVTDQKSELDEMSSKKRQLRDSNSRRFPH